MVGKHPAPSGALRLIVNMTDMIPPKVGKHPAPSGALRPGPPRPPQGQGPGVGKHPAPSGALRPSVYAMGFHSLSASGSTQHHQVH